MYYCYVAKKDDTLNKQKLVIQSHAMALIISNLFDSKHHNSVHL